MLYSGDKGNAIFFFFCNRRKHTRSENKSLFPILVSNQKSAFLPQLCAISINQNLLTSNSSVCISLFVPSIFKSYGAYTVLRCIIVCKKKKTNKSLAADLSFLKLVPKIGVFGSLTRSVMD